MSAVSIWASNMKQLLTVNDQYRKSQRLIIIDNFYKDPDSVRKFALEQDYHDDDGYIGRRILKI